MKPTKSSAIADTMTDDLHEVTIRCTKCDQEYVTKVRAEDVAANTGLEFNGCPLCRRTEMRFRWKDGKLTEVAEQHHEDNEYGNTGGHRA